MFHIDNALLFNKLVSIFLQDGIHSIQATREIRLACAAANTYTASTPAWNGSPPPQTSPTTGSGWTSTGRLG